MLKYYNYNSSVFCLGARTRIVLAQRNSHLLYANTHTQCTAYNDMTNYSDD